MESAEKSFAQHVEKRLNALKTNAFAVERSHGLPEDAVRSVLRGLKKSGTTLNNAQAICDALGLDFYIGPPRQPPVTHLQGQLREPAGDGPPILAPPTGYVTFVWHRACDPGIGIPPFAVSAAWARHHGLDPDSHHAVALGPRPRNPHDPGAFAVIDILAPRDGGPAPWAIIAAREGPVEVAPVQFIDRRAIALPTPARAELLDVTLYPASLLGRVLWYGAAQAGKTAASAP
jgi:hypothetical protein